MTTMRCPEIWNPHNVLVIVDHCN